MRYDENKINCVKKAESLKNMDTEKFRTTDDLSSCINDSEFAITEYEYNNRNNQKVKGLLDTMIDPEGNITCYEYYEDDTMGNLKKVVQYDDANSEPKKATLYKYDDMGNVESITYPEGSGIGNEYDKNGQLTAVTQHGSDGSFYDAAKTEYDKYGRIVKETSPKGNAYDYDYYPSGKVEAITDPEGFVKRYTYDIFGNLETESRPNGDYKYEYDVMNRLTKTYYKEKLICEYDYDYKAYSEKGKYEQNVVTKTDYIGDGNTLKTETVYDYAGRVVEQKVNVNKPVYTTYYPNGNVESVTDSRGNTTDYYYEKLNLLTKVESPFSKNDYSVIDYDYDKNGNKISEEVTINKPGETETKNKKEYQYNSRNLMDTVIQYDFSSGRETKNITQYYYDWEGRMLRMYTGLSDEIMIDDLDSERTSGDSVYTKTKYDYDRYYEKLGTVTDALGNSEQYIEYDKEGNLLKMIDRNNNTISYEYDSLNRVISKSVQSNDTDKSATYNYTYYFDTDKMETVSGEGVDTKYEYDNMGRLESETQANGVTKAYTYVGNSSNVETIKITVNGNVKVNTKFTYDDMMRLYTVSENGILEATYTYDENGNRKSLEYSNGNSVLYSYNAANKLDTLTNKNGSNVISQFLYDYYLDGNISSKIENVSNKSTEYIYDDLRRLTKESNTTNGNATTSISYTYDDNSNRKTMKVNGSPSYSVSYEYDNANRLQTEVKTVGSSKETTDYEYDKNGNQTSKTANGQSTTYSYDGFNRLTGVGSSIQYTYDDGELRTSKNVNGVETTQVWDGSNIVLELNASGEVLNKYVRGVNLIYSEDGRGANKKYYVYNGHGDVIQLTGTDGNVVKTYDYDAFGNEVNPDPSDTNHFRYCGEYWDEETGTIYLRARYYNPGTGRFISEDPAEAGLNWYVYANNNPVLYVDPSGLVSVVFVASEFKAQADIRAKHYTEQYKTASYVLEIDSAKNFNKIWENYFTVADRAGITIDAIEIICHGSISGKIGKDKSGTSYATSYMKFGDDTRVYARETNDMRSCDSSLSSISHVTAKELNVSSCNSANKDVYNVIYGFMQKTDIKTYSGFDGGAMWDSSGDYVRGGGDYKRTLRHPIDGYYYVKKYQKTWWKYVKKDADGSPARIREGRRTFKR